nr:unnamed protein product [Callosobruchus chinensis]
MASTEEDNKLESSSNVNKDQQKSFLTVYKKYELILNSRSESFENKIIAIVEVWKNIAELDFVEFGLRHVIQIMDWAKLHALNTVLTAEWNRFKDKYQNKLLEEIEKAQNEVLKVTTLFATSCEKLADVVRNPWEDPTLMKLMKCKDAEIGSAEIEFFLHGDCIPSVSKAEKTV